MTFFFLSISRLIYVLVSHLGSEVDDPLSRFLLFPTLPFFLVILLRCVVLSAVEYTSTFSCLYEKGSLSI